MNVKAITLSLMALVCLASCSSKESKIEQAKKTGKLNTELQFKDDHTVYGLACEGCTDSVLMLLPNDGSDPIRYNIIEAHRQHRIIGKPSTGDWVGLVVNKEDSTVADIVIDLDELKGTWCYVVMPKMRDYDKMPKKLQKKMMREMPDSVRETFMVPREYGFSLKRQFMAQSIGYVSNNNALQDESPVVYPKLPIYTAWHILNGKLVLTYSKMVKKGDNVEFKPIGNDTAEFVFMRDDSLVLRFPTFTQSYYRRANAEEANKRARAIAEANARKALEESKKSN